MEEMGLRKAVMWGLPRGRENFLDGLLPVGRFRYGGLHLFKPDEVSHEEEERHVHEGHYEVFVCVQGRGVVEVEGLEHEFRVGDVFLIEPGESHHVKADGKESLGNLFIGAEIMEE